MNVSRSTRGQSGFTLIELLIVISLSSVVLIPIFGLMNMTLLRVDPAQEHNISSSTLRTFRTHLINDWSRGQVIRIQDNVAPTDPNQTLTDFNMDCRGGYYPWFESNNAQKGIVDVRPAIAIQTHAAGNNSGRRIVYSIVEKTNGKIDIVRRECGHLPSDPLTNGELDYWAGSCPGSANPNSTICTIDTNNPTAEMVIARDVKALQLPTACNNVASTPPYKPCDANITLVATDGQSTRPRLYQPVVSQGRMVAGVAPQFVGYDRAGRPS